MLKNQWEIIKKSKIQLFLFVCLLGMHSVAFSKQKAGDPCFISSDCNRGLRCVLPKLKCEVGCNVAANCPYGNICKKNKCKAGCNLDSNCSLGQICTAGQCVAGCKNVINCPDDKLCIDGQCKVASNVARGGRCRNDANCQSGLKCKGIVKKCKQKLELKDVPNILKDCFIVKFRGVTIGFGVTGLVAGAALTAFLLCNAVITSSAVTYAAGTAILLPGAGSAAPIAVGESVLTGQVPACLAAGGFSVSAAVVAGLISGFTAAIGACLVEIATQYYI